MYSYIKFELFAMQPAFARIRDPASTASARGSHFIEPKNVTIRALCSFKRVFAQVITKCVDFLYERLQPNVVFLVCPIPAIGQSILNKAMSESSSMRRMPPFGEWAAGSLVLGT